MIFAGAMLNTIIAWSMIRLMPYRFWQRWLGEPIPLSDLPCDTNMPDRYLGHPLGDIIWAHAVLRRRFSKHFTCLMLAFSARAMLRRRGYPSVLVLGVNRDQDTSERSLGAHAWVVYQQYEVSGGEEKESFAAVAAYQMSTPRGSAKLGNRASCNK